jgi:hypothetical protein
MLSSVLGNNLMKLFFKKDVFFLKDYLGEHVSVGAEFSDEAIFPDIFLKYPAKLYISRPIPEG